MSAMVATETAFAIFQSFPIDHSIAAATQRSATGKRGKRNRGSPDAKNIPRLARNHTRTGILHSLVFLYARNTRGASTNTVGPKKSQRPGFFRSEEHTSELQSLTNLVCRLLLEKK